MKKEKFIIKGGQPLNGEIEVRGAKNAALPILAASLLTSESSIIDNLPLIEDIFKMLELLKGLGAKIHWLGKRKIKIDPSAVDPSQLPYDIVGFFRGSILIIGPLLARFGEVKMPLPGGCLIGARPIDTHLDAFLQLGAKITAVKGSIYRKKEKEDFFHKFNYPSKRNRLIKEKKVILREFSVTATENVLLFSSLSPGKTILKIADQDYQSQELIKVLEKMGALIKSIGPSAFEIIGKNKLHGFNHKIISDPIETATFIIASLATKGKIVVKKAQLSFLDLFLKRLTDFGAKFKILNNETIKVLPSNNLRIDKVQSLPYPGLHSDIQPELGVLATQTKGATLMHDPLYEGRLKYLEGLNKMGADIIFCGPHRAIVYGKTNLKGIEFPSPDLRAGAALVIAGLIASGETVINNIYQIDRGYEKIENRLQKLGAIIKRKKDNYN